MEMSRCYVAIHIKATIPLIWGNAILCKITTTRESRHTVMCQQPRKMHGTHNVLFMRLLKSQILASCIFVTARQICTKFTYFIPSIYTTLHTKFEVNCLSVSKICILKNSPIFFTFSSLHQIAPN